MRNMLLIARREYLEQVRGRAFRMTTVGLPAVFALIVGVGYLSSLGLGANRHMAVAATDPALANEIRDQLVGDKEAKATVDVIAPATPEQRAALVKQVRVEVARRSALGGHARREHRQPRRTLRNRRATLSPWIGSSQR